MPYLVTKMSIRRHGIYLTAEGPELLILIRQILQLRRTNKSEVCRIEEKHTPLPQNIFLRHKFEIAFAEYIGAEIGKFPC